MEELKKYLKEIGYSENDIEELVNECGISGLKPETLLDNIKRNYEFFISFGYSQEEVIKMTKMQPTIYSYSIENIKQKIKDLKKLGYNQEEIIKMTKKLPTIYGYSIENIKQKIKFYDSIGLHSLAVKDSKKLMQSTALSYARYMFYKDNGISIDETNYRKLFIGQKKFVKQYGITKKELLAKYDYKKYMESIEKKNTQELGEETLEEQNDIEFIDSIDEEQAKHQKAIRNKEQRK